MLKRKIYNKISEWKSKETKKPLLIKGMRQVGKTYIINEFGKNEYKEYVYITLSQKEVKDMFKQNNNVEYILQRISEMTKTTIRDETLIIIDEIQELQESLDFIKLFEESSFKNDLICSGSYIEKEILTKKYKVPVGKYDVLVMSPLTIEEFIGNLYGWNLISEIEFAYDNKKTMLESRHNELMQYLWKYMLIGGMPSVVEKYKNNSMTLDKSIMDELKELSQNQIDDLSRNLGKVDSYKVSDIYKSIIKNKSPEFGVDRFKFKNIKANSREERYKYALNVMNRGRVTIPVKMINGITDTLENSVSDNKFKLVFSDMGILSNNFSFEFVSKIIKDSNDKYSDLGYIVENYVAIQLAAKYGQLYYWRYHSGNTHAELEFLFSEHGKISAVEVKSGKGLKHKSLSHWIKTNKSTNKRIILSVNNFKYGYIDYLPLYASFLI